jgi:hypothetical protein
MSSFWLIRLISVIIVLPFSRSDVMPPPRFADVVLDQVRTMLSRLVFFFFFFFFAVDCCLLSPAGQSGRRTLPIMCNRRPTRDDIACFSLALAYVINLTSLSALINFTIFVRVPASTDRYRKFIKFVCLFFVFVFCGYERTAFEQ